MHFDDFRSIFPKRISTFYEDMKMQNNLPRPKVAYIGLSLELYLSTSGPELLTWQRAFDNWSRKLSAFADICCRKILK